MPLFYFRPFNFHPPKRPPVVEIKSSEVLVTVAIVLVATAIFAVVIVVPLVMILNESGAGF